MQSSDAEDEPTGEAEDGGRRCAWSEQEQATASTVPPPLPHLLLAPGEVMLSTRGPGYVSVSVGLSTHGPGYNLRCHAHTLSHIEFLVIYYRIFLFLS